MTISETLKQTQALLLNAGISNARQEAPWLLAHVLGRKIQTFLPDGNLGITELEQDALQHLLRRRMANEPLQYILGTTEFYSLELEVGPGVLIPRPETECLVEFAVEKYPGTGRICDLCTGSGAVALALAAELPDTEIIGVDISPKALHYAKKNLVRHGFGNVAFLKGDLYAPFKNDEKFALVTANPPYVSPSEYAALPPDVSNHEPGLALVAENDGLAILRRIAKESRSHLAAEGWLLCEIGSEQGGSVKTIFRNCGYCNVDIRQDYTGRDRVLRAQALSGPSDQSDPTNLVQ